MPSDGLQKAMSALRSPSKSKAVVAVGGIDADEAVETLFAAAALVLATFGLEAAVLLADAPVVIAPNNDTRENAEKAH